MEGTQPPVLVEPLLNFESQDNAKYQKGLEHLGQRLERVVLENEFRGIIHPEFLGWLPLFCGLSGIPRGPSTSRPCVHSSVSSKSVGNTRKIANCTSP